MTIETVITNNLLGKFFNLYYSRALLASLILKAQLVNGVKKEKNLCP